MIEVTGLTKSYGAHAAVKDVSFSVGRHEVVGFLGPNGAGKSTTLRMLVGFLGMSSGSVRIAGHDIVEEPEKARACIGYMPEAVPLYGEMRVAEYLSFRAELKGVSRRARVSAVGESMEQARVSDVATTLIANLSKGYKQRVGLADALVAKPPILILDEPTAGLDPNQIREIRTLVRSLGEHHTLLLSTHILTEVESTCSRALVIAKGKLVAEGSLADLRDRRRAGRAKLIVRAPAGQKASALDEILRRACDIVKISRDKPSEAELVSLLVTFGPTLPPGDALEEATAALVAAGYRVREATTLAASLDEVFSALTEDRIVTETVDEADEEAPSVAPSPEGGES